jgi:prepilin-type processing-associated H-X9-DG protein
MRCRLPQRHRAESLHHLRQIALACLNYESERGVLPPGYNGCVSKEQAKIMSPSGGQKIGDYPWVATIGHILPYLEHGQLYSKLQVNWNQTTPIPNSAWWENDVNQVLATTHIPHVMCPSDHPHNLTVGGHGPVLSIFDSNGYAVFVAYFFPNPYGDSIGKTNYCSVMGAACGPVGLPVWDDLAGVMYSQSKIKISDIVDGTSKTLMFGESLGGSHPGYPRDFAHSWIGSSSLPVAFAMPDVSGSPRGMFEFSSNHPGYVNFAFCDGSVHSLRKGDNPPPNGPGTYNYLLRELAGYKDGRHDDVSSIVID